MVHQLNEYEKRHSAQTSAIIVNTVKVNEVKI
jgi:hypothetical protein